jgi:hypothetical protein
MSETVTLTSGVGGAIAGNLILGGIIGGGIDMASGAAYKLYPETINVALRPDPRSEPTPGDDYHPKASLKQEPAAQATLKQVSLVEMKSEPIRRTATLTHVKGKMVTVPPTASQVEYNDNGEGRGTSRIIHPGNHIVEGEFQILPWDRAFNNQPRLIDLDKLVAPPNSQAKGFASYSSSDGTVIECAFSVSSSSRIDRGQCFDNRDNVYQISY